MMIKELEIGERFDLDDIRKMRVYNVARYGNVTPVGLMIDIKTGVADILKL